MQNPSGKNKDRSDGLEINRICKTGISEYDATYHVINSKEFQSARVYSTNNFTTATSSTQILSCSIISLLALALSTAVEIFMCTCPLGRVAQCPTSILI